MRDLTVVECRHAHEDARLDRHIELAVRVEAARDLERPVSGGPSRRTSNIGAIT
jgi:hypothetical protein